MTRTDCLPNDVREDWNTDPMDTRTQQPTSWRWALPFLAAIVAVLATILSTATASAASSPTAETRVGAHNLTAEVLIEPPQREAAGQRLGNDAAGSEIVVATGVAANAGARLEIQVGTKIEGQMAKRGWTQESVEELISNPSRTVVTRDTRYLPNGAGRNDAPATAYINRSGGYVVRNDETGDIVQVSNLNDPNWKSPW